MNSQKQKKKSIQKHKMDFLEKITLSPIEKYTRFNRFPWKLLVHLLLLIFTTIQVLSVVGTRTANARAQHQVFKNILLKSTDEIDTVAFNSFSDFKAHLHDLTEVLANMNQTLFQHVDLSIATFNLSVYYIEIANLNNVSYRSQFAVNLTEGIPKEFVDIDDSSALKNITNSINQLTFIGENIRTRMWYGDEVNSYFCNNWGIKIDYNFETFARIVANFDSTSTYCKNEGLDNEMRNFGESYLLIHIIVLVLACVSLFLSWKSIYQMAKDYMQYMFLYKNVASLVGKSNSSLHKMSIKSSLASEQQNSEEPLENMLEFKKSWEELSFFDKLKFFDFWFVFSILGNFIQINGSIIAILFILLKEKLAIFAFHEAIIGFGCMCAWILILKYLEYNKNINLMTTTLSNSGSTLLIFLLGVLPFYLAYVFLGQCLFWKTDKFKDTNLSVITLFSLSFGDIVNETFQNTKISGVLGELFLITFMLLFYTAVQNVFITIIMDGYEKSRREKKGKKVYEELAPITQQVPSLAISTVTNSNFLKKNVNESNTELLKIPLTEENAATSFMMQEDLLMDNKSFQKKQDFKKVESHKKSFVVSNYKDDEKKSDSVGERKNEKLEHFFEQENEEKTSKYKSLEDEQEEEKNEGSIKNPNDQIALSINDSKKKDNSSFTSEKKTVDIKGIETSPLQKIAKNDKDKILSKMKLNVGKIEKVLENLSKLATEIESIDFTPDDKMYLFENYKGNLEEIEKEVKYQINYIK